MMELVVVVVPLAILCTSIAVLLRKPSMELESRSVAEHVPRSPSLRLVALVVRELWRSSAAILAVIAVIVASIMAASTAASTLVTQRISFQPPSGVKGVSVCTTISPCLDPSRFWREAQLAIVQILEWVRVGSSKFMPMLITFRGGGGNATWLDPLRKAASGYLVIDVENRVPRSLPPGVRGVVREDLSPLVRIELAPSTPVVPSLGIVGGVSVSLRDPRKLALLPLNGDTLGFACRGGCVAKCVLVSFSSKPPSSLVKAGCINIWFSKSVAVVVSSARAPTPSSLASMALSTAMSSLVAIITCGVVVEKLRSFFSSLIVQGVSRDAITVASSMGALALSMLLLPVTAAVSTVLFGLYPASIAVATHISSSILFSYSISRYVSKRLGRVTPGVRTPVAIELRSSRSVRELADCVGRSLEKDDNFLLSELELLEADPSRGRYVLRLELVYRRAMAILVSVELELEKVGDRLRLLCALTEVWSFEEVSEKTRSVERLALSRAIGTLWLCSEAEGDGDDG